MGVEYHISHLQPSGLSFLFLLLQLKVYLSPDMDYLLNPALLLWKHTLGDSCDDKEFIPGMQFLAPVSVFVVVSFAFVTL